MREKLFILLSVISFHAAVLCAQCPPKDSMRKEIIQQHLSADFEHSKNLTVLLGYRDNIIKCGYRQDSVYAWLLNRISVWYRLHRDFSTAKDYLLQSINITRLHEKGSLPEATAIQQYYWLSICYDSLNNATAKIKAIDSCLSISDRLHYPYDGSSLRCLLSRLQYFYDIGEYKLCIEDAEICEKRALEYLKTVTNTISRKAGRNIAQNSFHWHVNALLRLKNFSEAETLLASKTTEYKKSGDKGYIALTYAQLAAAYEEEGDYQQALVGFNLALKFYRQNKNDFNCKQTLRNIGADIYFAHFKDYDKALCYFKDALGYINHDDTWNREDSAESLSIFGNIANVYVQKKLFDSAFFYFQLAFNQVKKGTNISYILNSATDEFVRIKKIDYLTNLLVDYGDAFIKKYEAAKQTTDLEEAISIYDKVDKVLARINVSQFEPDSKLLWRRNSRRLYENAIEACVLSGNNEKAFYFFERSRAVLLNIQLSQQNWLGNKDVSKSDELEKNIAALTIAINSSPEHTDTNNALKDSLRGKKDELYSLKQLIRTRYPLYYQNIDTVVLPIGEIKNKLLKEHQAILEFFSGDSVIYSLLVTNKKVVTTKIDKADFEKTVNLYTAYLSNHDLLNREFTQFRKISHHLYELILQNIPVPEGRIIISPEGYYFPFEPLVTDNTAAAPVYFLFQHAVSYTYSVRYLFNDFISTTLIPQGNLLGIAPVKYDTGFHLAELSGSDLSLKRIESSLTDSHLLLGKDASRNNFLQQYRNYKIIQLYTHASDSSDRKEPVIYFADSALYLSELRPEEKPVTSLIVLSACETGNGQLYQGEGVFSFNRGFAALGIPSSITNLWSINSKATYAVNELFYKYLAKGLPLDVAMQKAKLEYINEDVSGYNSQPYYWAAPILVGKTDPITLDKPFAWKYLLAGIALAGLAFFGWKKRRKRVAYPNSGYSSN